MLRIGEPMSRKLLPEKHHLASGCCMWSGIEDVYTTLTGQEVPEAFELGDMQEKPMKRL